MITFSTLPPGLAELLEVFPTKSNYLLLEGKKPYLPLEYYYEKADCFFGKANWSITTGDTPKFIRREHPTTGKFMGEMCLMSATLHLTGFPDTRMTRAAAVIYSKDPSGEFKVYQDISNTENAINKATAKAIKACFATLGNAFLNDYYGTKEAAWKGRNGKAKSQTTKANPSALSPISAALGSDKTIGQTPVLAKPTLKVVLPSEQDPWAVDAAKVAQNWEGTPFELKGAVAPVPSKTVVNTGDTPMMEAQYQRIETLLKQKGKRESVIIGSNTFKAWGLTNLLDMTVVQANDIIGKLEALSDAQLAG